MKEAQVDVTVSALHWQSAVFDVLNVHMCMAIYTTDMNLGKYAQNTYNQGNV